MKVGVLMTLNQDSHGEVVHKIYDNKGRRKWEMKYKHIYCEWDIDGDIYYPTNQNIAIRTCLYCRQQVPIAIKQICPKKPFLLGNLITSLLKKIGITEQLFNKTFNQYKVIGGCGTAMLVKVPKKEQGCRCNKRQNYLNIKHQYYKILRYNENKSWWFSLYLCCIYNISFLRKKYDNNYLDELQQLNNDEPASIRVYIIPEVVNNHNLCSTCGKKIITNNENKD